VLPVLQKNIRACRLQDASFTTVQSNSICVVHASHVSSVHISLVLQKQLQAKFDKEERRLEAEAAAAAAEAERIAKAAKAEEEKKARAERLARIAEENKKAQTGNAYPRTEKLGDTEVTFTKKPVAKIVTPVVSPSPPTPPVPSSPPASAKQFLTMFYDMASYTMTMSNILEKINSAPTMEDPDIKKLMGYLTEITEKIDELCANN
jgi:hypothetical protein